MSAPEYIFESNRKEIIGRYLRIIAARHHTQACNALIGILPEWQVYHQGTIAELKASCLRWHPERLAEYFASECYESDRERDHLHGWNADQWWHAFEYFLNDLGGCS